MLKRRCAYVYLCPGGLVDPVHVFTELGAVAVSVSVVLGDEQQGVNHFMKESLWKKIKESKGYAGKRKEALFLFLFTI